MKKVLLIINNQTFTRTMLRWEQVIRKSDRWMPIIFNTVGIDLDNQIQFMGWKPQQKVLSPHQAMGGWLVSGEGGISSGQSSHQSVRQRLRKILPSFAIEIGKILLQVKALIKHYIAIRQQLFYMRQLIQREKIKVLLICESSPAYDAPVYITAARAEGIPVVVCPIDYWSPQLYAEEYLSDEALNLKKIVNRWVGRIYPRWLIEYKGHRLLRMRPELLLPQEWLGLRHPHPWQMVGGWEDGIVLASDTMRDFYAKQEIQFKLFHVVGCPEHDIMADRLGNSLYLRKELYEELGINNDKPMILAALVQSHYLTGRKEAEFQNYSDLIEAWVKPLGSLKGFNVIISLHPSLDFETMRYIEKWGVKICQRDVATLIPLCDVYVSSTSTTIQWAITCGKPVVNYDIYRFSETIDSQAYPGAEGTVTVTNVREYSQILNRIADEPDYLRDLSARQAVCAQKWGLADGKVSERLTRLFEELAA